MAFDRQERKTLLYADLFKYPVQGKEKRNIIMSNLEGSSSSSSSNLSSSCDSSSSGFSTPFDWELGSSESEDGDFIAELTRQMAECMLQEEEEEKTVLNHVSEDSEESGPVKNYKDKSYVDSAAINNLKYGLYSDPVCFDARMPPLQVYQLKNQPPVSKQGPISPVSRERRIKGTESARQKQIQKTEQHYMQYRGRDRGIGYGRYRHSGSGMQAIFLGGSGSKSGFCGTGVFLPRATSDPAELKKKSGCSTVLMPTRVLQALELHFNNRIQNSRAPPVSGGSDPNLSSPKDEWTRSNELQNGHSQLENLPADKDEEMQLPQEWTY